MREVCIIGVGQTSVGEHWGKPLRILGMEAMRASLLDAGVERPEVLYVGNMLSGQLSRQENLGALLADHSGLRGIEAVKVEAACGSGAAALRQAFIAVASGVVDVAMACGVEKMTEAASAHTTFALSSAADAKYEADHGLSFVSLNALLMRRYLFEYRYEPADLTAFSVNAHANAVGNPHAMFRRALSSRALAAAKPIADPVTLLDSAPVCDGAAAVVLAPLDLARENGLDMVRIAGSAVATDSVALHDRGNPLFLASVHASTQRALAQARVAVEDIDFLEAHDAFTVMAALSLEASGFCAAGEGARLAMDGEITRQGRIPISTMGGLKARGHPVGATGIYQAVEATLQLRGDAGECQIPGCRLGTIQNIGGSGAWAATHILERL